MISINVNTNSIRKTTMADVTATPNEIFEGVGADVSTSMVSLDGMPIRGGDFSKTFEQLGVADGATIHLRAIVKADGARVR